VLVAGRGVWVASASVNLMVLLTLTASAGCGVHVGGNWVLGVAV